MTQLDTTDIYGALHPTATEYTFFSNADIWNILQNRTYVRPKYVFKNLQGVKLYTVSSPIKMELS